MVNRRRFINILYIRPLVLQYYTKLNAVYISGFTEIAAYGQLFLFLFKAS